MSNRSGHSNLYQQVSDGSQVEQRLPSVEDAFEGAGGPTQWSRDGRYLMFFGRRRGLWILPMTDGREPFPFLSRASDGQGGGQSSPDGLSGGQLSPDGRWMAYESDLSGAGEVYVRPFPPNEGKWQVSHGSGAEPKWRGDGKELFYLASDGRLMSVAVRTQRGFAPDVPRPLFDTALSGRNTAVTGRNRYDVTADGQRFLLIQPVGPPSPPMTVVVNWPSTLRP
jgi:hypothetical protein